MKILYRISDGGNNKPKPDYVYNKKQMFLHFIKIFANYDIYVFADNVKDDTYTFLEDKCINCNNLNLYRISLGNAASFIHVVDFTINNFNDNDKIYFAEDDYIYKSMAPKIIEEGLNLAEYSSGYDHPDKYMNYIQGGPNKFIENGGELSRVMVTDNSHWKFTNSCCMTFATTVNIMKQDYDVFKSGCLNKDPSDFTIFCELVQNQNRKIASSIPGVSTHGELEYLSKFVDWEKEFYNSLNK